MPDAAHEHDVVVVGGGFSGLVAARDLSEQGFSVLQLEARDRIGGRAWTRRFADTDRPIELGGGYIHPPGQMNLMAELQRYGIEVAGGLSPQSFPTLIDGQRRPGPLPVPAEELPDLERAVFRFVEDAARIELGVPLDRQGVADLDIPYDEYLDALDLPPATRGYLGAWPARYLGRYPVDASALQLLAFLPMVDRSMIDIWAVRGTRVKGGTKVLLDAIAEDSDVDRRLDAPVIRIVHDDDGVTVTTANGDVFSAGAVVVATPMACWNDIVFDPPLSAVKREASDERNVAYPGKLWALIKNAPQCPFVLAAPESTNGACMISTDYDFGDEGQLMVGFVVRDPEERTGFTCDAAGIAEFVETMLPGAEVVKSDAHDWVTDPWSGNGAWVAYAPGRLSKSHSQLSVPEGRVHFATADIAHGFLGWIEGAIEMGHRGASTVQRTLARDRAVGAAAS